MYASSICSYISTLCCLLNLEPYTPLDWLCKYQRHSQRCQLTWVVWLTEIPPVTNLKEVQLVRYGKQSESTCHVAIDFVIIACNMQLRAMYPDHHPAVKAPSSTTLRLSTPETLPGLLTVFPKLEISVATIDPATRALLRIAGRADWAYGYDALSCCSGSYVIAVETKQRATLGSAELQLLAYLAIVPAPCARQTSSCKGSTPKDDSTHSCRSATTGRSSRRVRWRLGTPLEGRRFSTLS